MRILVKLPTWLGDAVMATPALELLRARFPEAHFTYIGSSATCALFERDSRIERLIVDDSKKAKGRIKGILMLARRAGRHDLAITFQNTFLSALLLFLTRSKTRIGFANEARSFLLSYAPKIPKNIHQVERYVRLLQPLGIGAKSLSSKNRAEFSEAIPSLCVYSRAIPPLLHAPKVIGINPGAAYGSAKRWTQAHFSTLISLLLERGYGVVICGGEGDREGNERILATLKPSPLLLDLTAKTSLSELIDTIATFDLFITNDSGPMHLACALKVPLIALFGSTDHTETSPYNPSAPMILLSKHLPCSPCKKRVCPLSHHNCMELLLPSEVMEAVRSIFAQREFA